MKRGDLLVWRHTPRGGYGYSLTIRARFVAWGSFDRVRVEVEKADGEVVPRTIRDVCLVRVDDGVRLDKVDRTETAEQQR